MIYLWSRTMISFGAEKSGGYQQGRTTTFTEMTSLNKTLPGTTTKFSGSDGRLPWVGLVGRRRGARKIDLQKKHCLGDRCTYTNREESTVGKILIKETPTRLDNGHYTHKTKKTKTPCLNATLARRVAMVDRRRLESRRRTVLRKLAACSWTVIGDSHDGQIDVCRLVAMVI